MVRSGMRVDLSSIPGVKVGQAQHGRRRRQGVDRAGAARRRVWGGRPEDVGARAGSYRRHARQARGDSRLPHRAHARRVSRGVLQRHRLLPHQPDQGHRPRRQEALRAARRHGDDREHPAHFGVGDEQEDRRRQRRRRAGRQVRQRRVHEDARRCAGAGPFARVDRHRQRRCRTEAFITSMDAPLGPAVGNALEIVECIEALQGQGPPDLEEVIVRLARRMVVLVGSRGGRRARRSACARRPGVGRCAGEIRGDDRAAGRRRPCDSRSVATAARRARQHVVRRRRTVYRDGWMPNWVGRASMLLGAGRDRVDASHRSGRAASWC